MNADITILRIFDDYLQELETKRQEPEVKRGIEEFEKEFVSLRAEIDELRHQMHIHKMGLAAYARESKPFDAGAYKADTHEAIKKRYLAYNKNFKRIQKEFKQFEERWLC